MYRCSRGHETDKYHQNYVTKMWECGHSHCTAIVVRVITIDEKGNFSVVGDDNGFREGKPLRKWEGRGFMYELSNSNN